MRRAAGLLTGLLAAMSVADQQIYLDTITDLLQPNAPVELREDPKEGVYVSGCEWAQIHDVAGAIELLG